MIPPSVKAPRGRRWAQGLSVLCSVLMALLVGRLGSGCRGADAPVAPGPGSEYGTEPGSGDGPGPTWIVDPETPGPDLPTVGRSLFDFVVTRETEPEAGTEEGENVRRVWDVPFPFAALVARVEARLGVAPARASGEGSYDRPYDGSAEAWSDQGSSHQVWSAPGARSSASPTSPVRRVLIPLGRSLQRAAGAPRFFRFPRAVAAVDREPAPRQTGEPASVRPLLADRLYLGYHEKAEVVEVISYNEAAGRFEFQVVEDYRPGGRPRVTYAPRRLCTACHQNGAPLFARQLWDETNANRRVAELLDREGRDFYGFPVHQGVDEPYRVDIATDRANRFAAWQLLWREGCESPGCRGALLVAALQSRLTGGRRYDSGSPELRESFLGPLVETFRRRWPRGLALPNPDIPNRDPLAEALPGPSVEEPATGSTTAPDLAGLSSPERAVLGEVLAATHIPARLEPLDRRPPLEVWRVESTGDTDGTNDGNGVPEALIAGLGELVADADLRRLDRWLFQRADIERRRFAADCRVSVRRAAGGFVDRIKVRCEPASVEGSGAIPNGDGGLELDARVYLDASGRVVGGTVHRAVLVSGGQGRGAPELLRDLEMTGGRIELDSSGDASRGRLELAEKASGLHVRRADGDALEELRLSWESDGGGSAKDLVGRAELVVRGDFAPVRAAVEALRRRTETGESDALSGKPFRRAVVMRELLAELGAAAGDEPWCCIDASGMPPAVLQNKSDARHPEKAAPEEPVALFHHYCGECHDIPSPSPPNFLYGSPERVRASLESCAERIFFRLSMWQRTGAGRAKTPMPPEPALVVHGLSAPAWAAHPDLDRLRRHAGESIRAHGDTPPRFAEMTSRAYELLPSCLPTDTRRAPKSGE